MPCLQFKMPKTLIFISFMVLVTLAGMLGKTQAFQRYCGKSLTDYMEVLCKSGFNGKPLKRNNLLDDSKYI